jgi:hypothetical protein
MNIIPKEKIVAAVERCLALHGDHEAAIEAVAQSMHLSVETVRECIEGVEA